MRENLDLKLLNDHERLAVETFYEAHLGHDVQPVLFEMEPLGKA